MEKGMSKKRGLIITLTTLVIFGVGLWTTRPMWHWFFMTMYRNPGILESVIAAFITGGIVFAISKKHGSWDCLENAGVAFGIMFVIATLIIAPFQLMYSQCKLARDLEVSEISKLPDIDPLAVRIMPMAVSKRYAEDALQYPRYRLGTGDITFINKRPCWVYPLVPDGKINFFILKDKGAVYVDMSTSEKNSIIVEQEMKIGVGMGITDWYKWQLYKRKYWVDYEDPYFIPTSEKELYIAVPIISYQYHFRFPTFYTVPRWEGIALINSKGQVEFLTPEQALRCPVLKGQKLFPERLARYYIGSFRYINGIINKVFYHKDQLEIAEYYQSEEQQNRKRQNKQPFLVKTKDGIKWFIACEPYGKAHGIFRIYLVDGRTGEIQFYQRPKTEALIGPVKACDYLRRANPIIDWNRMIPVEPIPVTIQGGRLYWEVRVVPKDASGVAYTAMVDAQSANVVELKKDKSIRQFISGGHKTRKVKSKKIPIGTAKEEITAMVVILQNGHEVQRIPLFPNQTVEIIPEKQK